MEPSPVPGNLGPYLDSHVDALSRVAGVAIEFGWIHPQVLFLQPWVELEPAAGKNHPSSRSHRDGFPVPRPDDTAHPIAVGYQVLPGR